MDNLNILREIEQVTPNSDKMQVRRTEQGKEFFQNYSFQTALLELDELFDT